MIRTPPLPLTAAQQLAYFPEPTTDCPPCRDGLPHFCFAASWWEQFYTLSDSPPCARWEREVAGMEATP